MDQCIFLHLNENEYVALYCSICISIAQVKLLSHEKTGQLFVCIAVFSQYYHLKINGCKKFFS